MTFLEFEERLIKAGWEEEEADHCSPPVFLFSKGTLGAAVSPGFPDDNGYFPDLTIYIYENNGIPRVSNAFDQALTNIIELDRTGK